MRYPRGSGPGVAVEREMTALPIGKGEVRRQGAGARRDPRLRLDAAPSLAAADELDATVANMRFVKPLDEALVCALARETRALVTVEENVVMGGAGSAVAEALAAAASCPVLQLGLPDRFIDQGDPAQCWPASGSTRRASRRRFAIVSGSAAGPSVCASLPRDARSGLAS